MRMMGRRATKVVARPRSVEQGSLWRCDREAGCRRPWRGLSGALHCPIPCGAPRAAAAGATTMPRSPTPPAPHFAQTLSGRGFPGAWHCCSAGRCDPASACEELGRGGAHQAAFHDPNQVAGGCSRTRPAATESQPPRYRLHLASRHAAPERSPRAPVKGSGSAGEHEGRAGWDWRCERVASLRTCRGATLRDPSRKAAVAPARELSGGS
jgi:hypothetical protein